MALPGDIVKEPKTAMRQLLDLYHGITSVGDSAEASRSFKHPEFGLTLGHTEREELVRTFSGIYDKRDDLIRSLNSIRNMDCVQTIVDVVIDDAFKGSEQNYIFDVEFKDPAEKDGHPSDLTKRINERIQEFLEKVKLRPFLEDAAEDLLLLGEYPFRPIREKGKGITAIEDDLNPATVVAIYRRGEPEFYLEKKGDKIYIRHPEDIMHFCLAPRKVRINVADYRDASRRQIPENVRIGRSLVYPALALLKRLQVFEMATVAGSLNKILTPAIVSVGVPANATPQDVTELIKRYEKTISENRTSLNPDGQMEFADLLASCGRVKVIPNFADGKGALSRIDVDNPEVDAGATESRLRRAVALAVGIPPYYLSLDGDTGLSKVETLKIYSRYSRKLVAVQEALAHTVRQLVNTHLKLTGSSVNPNNLKVLFKSIVNTDLLDSMEYAVASTQVLSDFFNTINSMAESPNLNVKIDTKKWLKLVDNFTSVVPDAKGLLVPMSDAEMNFDKNGGAGAAQPPVGAEPTSGQPDPNLPTDGATEQPTTPENPEEATLDVPQGGKILPNPEQ